MASKTVIEVQGSEYDWLACDAEDHVALFSTAGGSYAPIEFLHDTEAYFDAIDAIIATPRSTLARFAPEMRSDQRNDWLEVAERGLFAFDGDYCGGPYRIVAAPAEPIRVAELPPHVVALVRRLALRHLHFATLEVITADMLRQAEPQPP